MEKIDFDLNNAYEACREETARWAKTFYLGTMLLPPQKRKAIWAIYVWCRRTDELMDSKEAQTLNNEELTKRLDIWEQKTRDLFLGKIQDDLDAVMVDTLTRYPQPLQPYLDMIDGQRMDLEYKRYKTFKDLELYCYRVAGTVGLMTQGVIGVDSLYIPKGGEEPPDTSQAAIALGIANQLTNILRDVGEDRSRGRIYLPLEDLERFDYSEQELLEGVINDQWKNLMIFELERAREWFKKSEEGIRWLSIDARWPVWASLRLYRGILDSIESLDYDVFNNRAYVNSLKKAIDLPISYFATISNERFKISYLLKN